MINLFKNFNELFENRTTYKVGVLQDRAYRTLKNKTREILKEKKITTFEWASLGVVYEEKEVTPKELADLLGVTQPFISKMLKDLIKKNLVYIEKCPTDSRVKCIYMTENGKNFVKETEPFLRSRIKPLLEGLSLTDLSGYIKVLTKISNQNSLK